MRREKLKLLLVFVAVYLSWDAYALLYPFIGRWSVSILPYFLKLPLTSYSFEYSLVSWTVSHGFIHETMRVIYNTGFTGSMFLSFAYSLGDERLSWKLVKRYAIAFSLLALSFTLFHVYAPHRVYILPDTYAPNNPLTPPQFVFPSPHCAVAFASLMVLWSRKSIQATLIKVYLLLVPISTVLLGEHWIWDVLGGFLIALISAKIEKMV